VRPRNLKNEEAKTRKWVVKATKEEEEEEEEEVCVCPFAGFICNGFRLNLVW
jgi:hypothetical protein